MEGEGKLSKFLSTDIASRIMALVIAIIVWIYVVILLDPAIDIWINDIPVIYTNTVNLTNEDYVLMNEKATTVSLRLRGSRTMLAKIDKEDITAYVDLDGKNQTGTFLLPISARLPYEEVSVIDKKPYNINVTIDKLITQTFPVTIEVVGNPQEGFEVFEAIASQSSVELKGANDVVTSVDRVEVSIDVSGASTDVVGTRALTFYNTNDDIITSKHISSTPDKLEIRCQILKKKTVPVKAVMTDQTPNHIVNVIASNYITILAEPHILDGINEINTKPINVSNIRENTKVTTLLDFPEGVVPIDGMTEMTVEILVRPNED